MLDIDQASTIDSSNHRYLAYTQTDITEVIHQGEDENLDTSSSITSFYSEDYRIDQVSKIMD